MRIWHPIPVVCLDDKRLIAEHHELHTVWSVITKGLKGYSKHPEVVRWKEHKHALLARHRMVVIEMVNRGYKHKSPFIIPVFFLPQIADDWPDPIEPVSEMRAKLAAKIKSTLQ